MSNQIKHAGLAIVFIALFAQLFFGYAIAAEPQKAPILLRYEIVRTLPHDPSHFTQGLILHRGKLIESVGGYGRSALLQKDLQTGRVLQRRANSAQVFAEGLTAIGNRLYQLTWRERTAYVYDESLRPVGQRRYPGEGWGLATLDHPPRLLLSDGSAYLKMLDPAQFKTLGEIRVHQGVHDIPLLNELEVADGLIYANVWQTDLIAVISPTDGGVLAWLNLGTLKERFKKPREWNAREHVLNGIAYDPASGLFYVTGKCWPVLYEIRIDRTPLSTQPGTATPQ